MKYKPGVYDAPVLYSPETCDKVQYLADRADLLNSLRADLDISEEDSLRYMNLGIELLSGAHLMTNQHNSDWHREYDKINPKKDLAGFISWQGTSEPEAMAQNRAVIRITEGVGHKLSDSIVWLALDSYVKFHGEEIAEPEKGLEKSDSFIRLVASAYHNKEPLPLSEEYETAFKNARKLDFFKISFDKYSDLLNSLVEQRHNSTETGIASQKEKITEHSNKIHSDLSEIWEKVFTPNEEFAAKWAPVYDNLIHDAGLQDRVDDPKALLIKDAVQLLARIQQIVAAYSGEPYLNDKLEEAIFDSVRMEDSLLRQAASTLESSQEFEDNDLSVEMLADIRPRLKNAILYLLKNDRQIISISNAAKVTDSVNTWSYNWFWRKALYGKNLPDVGYRANNTTSSTVTSHPVPSSMAAATIAKSCEDTKKLLAL